MYLLLGVSILLAALLSFITVGSVAACLAWRLLDERSRLWPAAHRASTLFWLRMMPVIAGFGSLLFLLIPAYIQHEPRSTTEVVSYKLALIAFASAMGIMLAIVRGMASWYETQRLIVAWLSQAQLIAVPGVNVPVYKLEHQFPLIAVVGVLRPRLFIATQVLERLKPEEISSAIRHELGHLAAQDNLKRALLRACRDLLLFIPCGRSLDHAWTEAAEAAADEHAARCGQRVALDLASALVKIARLAPRGMTPVLPAGTFLFGDRANGIRTRVPNLIHLAESTPQVRSWTQNLPWLSFVSILLLFILAATHGPALAAVHSFIEGAVYLLN